MSFCAWKRSFHFVSDQSGTRRVRPNKRPVLGWDAAMLNDHLWGALATVRFDPPERQLSSEPDF
jgi:hypothetical protein